MKATDQKRIKRKFRQKRGRQVIQGTSARPRLSVFRSLQHIYGQLIDDVKGVTIASVSTNELKGKSTKTEGAAEAGTLLAERAKTFNIASVVFDRGGNKYHGRVKALAEAAREAGLQF